MPILIVILAVWLLKRSTLTKWSWNPLSWWNDATGAAGGVISTIRDWVLGVVSNAVNLVENDVQSAFSYAVGSVDWLFGLINQVETESVQWFQYGIHYAEQLLTDAEGFAQRLINDVRSWAAAAIQEATNLAEHWVNDAVAWASSAIANLGAWAGQLVANLGAWAANEIGSLGVAITDGLAHLLAWVESALAKLWTDLYNTVYNDFIRPIMDVIHIAEKAIDWLIWFADHPFDVMRTAENDLLHWLQTDATGALESATDDGVARIEDTLGRWLGVR